MMNNKSFEIQNQIRHTAQQAHEQMRNLKQWEVEMKDKEAEMKKQLEQHSNQIHVFINFRLKEGKLKLKDPIIILFTLFHSNLQFAARLKTSRNFTMNHWKR